MPPKPKYTRAEIADATFDLVRTQGIEALSARELAKQIGTSTRPIFTAFKDMDDLKGEIHHMAGGMLGVMFFGMMGLIKSGKLHEPTPVPYAC